MKLVIVLLWAFRVWAQFDGDPVEDGWVTTATREACEAGRRTFADAARIYGSAVDLGPCQRMSPDEVRRLTPHPAPTLTSRRTDRMRRPRCRQENPGSPSVLTGQATRA